MWNMFKVNNKLQNYVNEICSKLTIKTPERRQWRRCSVSVFNFEHISHFHLVFLLLTLNKLLFPERAALRFSFLKKDRILGKYLNWSSTFCEKYTEDYIEVSFFKKIWERSVLCLLLINLLDLILERFCMAFTNSLSFLRSPEAARRGVL